VAYYRRRRTYYSRSGKADRFGMFTDEQAADASVRHLARKHFPSVGAYLEWIESSRAANLPHGDSEYLWNAGSSYGRSEDWNATQGVATLRAGDLERGKRFAAQAKAFGEALPVYRTDWKWSVMGAHVVVPAALSGRPDSMRQRVIEKSSREPLRIWVGLTASAGVSPEQIERRGAAICAFAIALGRTRRVKISPYVLLGGDPGVGAILSYDLATPLVLSQVAAALATPSVTRGLGIAACYYAQPACYGTWWRDYDDPERMRAQLGCKPEDVYLGSIHMSDPLLTDPVAWIKENLSHLLS
jgi:hypothetical protein